MSLGEIGTLISTIGFPVFVAVWMLIRTDKILGDNTKATHELTAFLKTHLTK